jgi:hypothetical protein
MDHHNIPDEKIESPVEAVVNGAFLGLLAGGFMALYVLLAGMVVAGSDWAYVRYLDLAHSGLPWLTVFTQLAVSTGFGSIFGLLCNWSRPIQEGWMPAWLAGMAYSMVLWTLTVGLILPKDHFSLNPLASVYLLFAYLVYGLTLGLRQKL